MNLAPYIDVRLFKNVLGITVKRVRVLVANRSRLVRDLLLATIADQPDIEVVGEVFEESQLTDAVDELQPDALIVTLDDPENRSALSGFLLGRYPKMRILALAPERNQGLYFWAVTSIRSQRLESSESSVLNALRSQLPLPASS
jgi:AmiR/NasT family two-component response regulator